MLKETETEKKNALLLFFFIIGGISIGGWSVLSPLPGNAYDEVGS